MELSASSSEDHQGIACRANANSDGLCHQPSAASRDTKPGGPPLSKPRLRTPDPVDIPGDRRSETVLLLGWLALASSRTPPRPASLQRAKRHHPLAGLRDQVQSLAAIRQRPRLATQAPSRPGPREATPCFSLVSAMVGNAHSARGESGVPFHSSGFGWRLADGSWAAGLGCNWHQQEVLDLERRATASSKGQRPQAARLAPRHTTLTSFGIPLLRILSRSLTRSHPHPLPANFLPSQFEIPIFPFHALIFFLLSVCIELLCSRAVYSSRISDVARAHAAFSLPAAPAFPALPCDSSPRMSVSAGEVRWGGDLGR